MGMLLRKRVGKGAVEVMRDWVPIIIALVLSGFKVSLLADAHA